MSERRCDRCANLHPYCRCGDPAPAPQSEPVDVKRCTDCGWAMVVQYGWSNYTVEGSYVHCRKNLLPGAPIDDFYGEETALEFATTCPRFTPGAPGVVDVDREDLDELTPDQRVWLDALGEDS